MSSNSTSPGSIYGGTWASISGGRYMRAASAWGNGGSNYISSSQLPAHAHALQGNILAFQSGKGNSNVTGGSSVDILSHLGINTSMSTGGGQHFILRTRTFGRGIARPNGTCFTSSLCSRGTELPKEGDVSCVTFKQFKSGLVARLKRFVHSQLATSICQATRQVQQTFMAARGQLSQMVDFGEQVAHGIVQAEQAQTRIITGCRSARKMVFRVYRLLVLAAGQMEQHILCVRQRLLTVFLRKILILVQVVETQQNQPLIAKPSQRFRLTAPVIVGTAQPSYIGGVC